ncbi:hypothetical protein [Pseudomonas protegens]|uniref:hypothetical protein n=1 Tax=Pseudomonas protegens TaxID=380021 RepID=UPI00383AEAC0
MTNISLGTCSLSKAKPPFWQNSRNPDVKKTSIESSAQGRDTGIKMFLRQYCVDLLFFMPQGQKQANILTPCRFKALDQGVPP